MSPFLESFKRFPQQIQNLGIIQKIQDKISRPGEEISCQLNSIYGQLSKPSCLDYDEKLGLLAIGSKDGRIQIYGAPGVVFEIPSLETAVLCLKFLPEEGRLLVLSGDNDFIVFEFNNASSNWDKKFAVRPALKTNEAITSMCLGTGMIYYGSDLGNLRQAAIKHGQIALDDESNTLTCEMLTKNASLEKQEELSLDSTIVSVELHASGSHLLIAYRGGTVAIAKILSIPEPSEVKEEAEAPAEEPAKEAEKPEINGTAEDKKEEEGESPKPESSDKEKPSETKQASATMAPASKQPKEESSLMKKSRTLTMTLKNNLTHLDPRSKYGHYEQPALAMPPMPKVTNFFTTERQCFWASWTYQSLEDTSALKFVAALSEGYYVHSAVNAAAEDVSEPVVEAASNPNNPFGPIPCHAIRKISMKPCSSEMITAFMGGLSTQEITDMYTVVVNNSKENVAFRFSDEVVDFILIPSTSAPIIDGPRKPSEDEETRKQEIETWKERADNHVTQPCNPSDAGYLIVLTQNEIVAIDLTTQGWPQLVNPYLSCVDISTVSSMAHITSVPKSIVERIEKSNFLQKQQANSHWPINAGAGFFAKQESVSSVDLLALGHEDGTVSLWSMGAGNAFSLLGMLHGCSITNFAHHDSMEATPDEAWPPYRSVGSLQQFSLTPARYTDSGSYKCDHCCCPVLDHCKCNAIRSLYFFVENEELSLVTGGQLGQVTLWSTSCSKAAFEPDAQRVLIELVHEEELADAKFSWNGPAMPKVREGTELNCKWSEFAMKPQRFLQLYPPSPIVHLSMEHAWHLLAIGSQHGMAVYDTMNERLVHKIFTPSRISSHAATTTCPEAGEHQSADKSRVSSLKNKGGMLKSSLRQSFKKLRKFTSHNSTDSKPLEPTAEEEEKKPEDQDGGDKATESKPEETAAPVVEEAKPEEGSSSGAEAEAPEVKEAAAPFVNLHPAAHPWAVRSVTFGCTTLISSEKTTPVMFVGTGSGTVYMYDLIGYFEETPATELKLCKELQLQHAAPIVGLMLIDAKARCPIACLTLDEVKAQAKEELEKRLAEEARVKAEAEAAEKAKKEAEEAAAKKAAEEEAAKKAEAEEKPKEEKEAEEKKDEPVEKKEEEADEKKAPEDDSNNKPEETKKSSKKEKSPEPAPVPKIQHDLIVCSEEQVKLFSLPTLKPKHKYKFLDRGTFTHLHAEKASTKTPVEAKEDTEAVNGKPAEENCCRAEAVSCHHYRRKRIVAVGLQGMPVANSSVKEAAANEAETSAKQDKEWYVVAGLSTGSVSILSIPSLRRQVKCCVCASGTTCCMVDFMGLSADGHSVVAHCPATNSVGVVETCASSHHLQAHTKGLLFLEPWMRSGDLLTMCSDLIKEAATVATETVKQEVEQVVDAVTGAGDKEKKTDEAAVKSENNTPSDEMPLKKSNLSAAIEKEGLNSPADKSILNGGSATNNLADMTMDTVKDYLNGEGQVTVHTEETSTIKKTVIKDGEVVTTIHEQELKDGKLVKDDITSVGQKQQQEA